MKPTVHYSSASTIEDLIEGLVCRIRQERADLMTAGNGDAASAISTRESWLEALEKVQRHKRRSDDVQQEARGRRARA